MTIWEPYIPNGALFCVAEASCCEEYVLCSESSEYFVRRRGDDGKYEETARGSFLQASAAWVRLAAGHVHEGRVAS